MARVFITGASGYIGGQALHAIATAHPELSFRALVRDSAKAKVITKAYPHVQTVAGSLSDEATLRKEVNEADIILNLAAAGNLASVQTIHQALKHRTDKPAHWIQISGASILAAAEIADDSRKPGSPSDAIFDDLDGAPALRDFIKAHPNRAVDNYILSVAESTPQVKTALVFPPIVYGPGQGPVNQRSIQIPTLAKVTLQRGKGFQVGEGLNRWGEVHVQDLGRLFLALVERALSAVTADGDGVWNSDGLYLVNSGETSFGHISQLVTRTAADKGWISNNDIDELSGEDINELVPHGTALFGTNARSTSRRAVEKLGWKPQHADGLDSEIERVVVAEAKALGLS